MKVVLQRVINGAVRVDDKIISEIGKGYVLLVGIASSDNNLNVLRMVQKISDFRVFSDEKGKMNLNIKQVKGEILSVPQFTLIANTEKGNRPGFDFAAKPAQAEVLWDLFNEELKKQGLTVKNGLFGAHMNVKIVNSGPVTFVLEN